MTVNNQTTTQTLKVAQHASITGNLFVNNDALITGDLMVKTLAGNCLNSSGNNTSCRAKITPNGTLVRGAIEPGDIEGWDEPDLVFARGENKNFFADTNGSPSSVSNINFLRVGITDIAEHSQLPQDDMGMMVGGAIESRGGLIIKKVDNVASNQGKNRNVIFGSNDPYTSMDIVTETP